MLVYVLLPWLEDTWTMHNSRQLLSVWCRSLSMMGKIMARLHSLQLWYWIWKEWSQYNWLVHVPCNWLPKWWDFQLVQRSLLYQLVALQCWFADQALPVVKLLLVAFLHEIVQWKNWSHKLSHPTLPASNLLSIIFQITSCSWVVP